MADGLPLYGAQGDSFSLLQVPPLDLAQVEIIKGAASALYGASALGGVINLVSRRPAEAERELLINATSQSGHDVTSWLANPIGDTASWTLLGGFHRQSEQDLDDDGWLDLPGFERVVLRPRLFTDNGAGKTMFATLGVMAEDRNGGTSPGRTLPDGAAFTESLNTRHVDGGFVGRWLAFDNRVLAVRGSYMRRSQDRTFGPAVEHSVRSTWFGEVSVQGSNGRQTWVGGRGVSAGSPCASRAAPVRLPLFEPVDLHAGRDRASRTNGRWPSAHALMCTPNTECSRHRAYRCSPDRHRAGPIRVAAGTGAFAPTPFTEETEETGLSRLRPLRGLRAERARNTSLDVTRVFGSIEVTGTVFGSVVLRPIVTRTLDTGDVEFLNAPESTRTARNGVAVAIPS